MILHILSGYVCLLAGRVSDVPFIWVAHNTLCLLDRNSILFVFLISNPHVILRTLALSVL